jgi:hypothetical protein
MPSVSPLAIASAIFFLVSPSPRPPLRTQTCTGCVGSANSATVSGGSCGGLVSIQVNVQSGHCKVLSGEEPGDIQCRPSRNCVPTISRSWAGLEPWSDLDFCVVLNGQRLCVFPKPTAGPGAGSESRDSAAMECSSEPSNARWYSIESPSCGLFATAKGECSACNDYF